MSTRAAYVTGGTLFEELGFYYVGPIDGHNLDHLLPVLRNVRDAEIGPILVHVVTQKGKGYAPAETSADKYHGVVKFDVATGAQAKSKGGAPQYTKVFGESLIKEARKDDKIVAITAAMPSGTGLDLFAEGIPQPLLRRRHCRAARGDLRGGLATEGFKPFAAIYSTFLQRAYDQVVHDVAIQRLPVRFAIDRAGLVGADGPTHAGAFDVAYLGCLPGFVLMAAADEAELVHMVATQSPSTTGRRALRYPRGEGLGVPMPAEGMPLEIGKGRILREGHKVALFSYGARLGECLKAADELAALGLSTTVADARFAKPLDIDLLLRLAREHEVLVTIEEGAVGGFGSYVLQALADNGVLDGGCKVRTMVLPDVFLDQDTPGRDVCQGRPRRPRHRRQGVRGARQGRRRRDGEAGVGWLQVPAKKDRVSIACWSSAACSTAAPRRRPRSRPGWSPPTTTPVRKASEEIAVDAALSATPAHPYVSRGGREARRGARSFRLRPERPRLPRCRRLHRRLHAGFARARRQARLCGRCRARPIAREPARAARGRVAGGDRHPHAARRPDLREPPDLVTVDVSFISLKLVLPAALSSSRIARATRRADQAAIRGRPRRRSKRASCATPPCIARSATTSSAFVASLGWRVLGIIPSPIAGGDGNAEFLLGAARD